MILDSLRYWVKETHVDGFRFDLAAILQRDESGQMMPNPPVLWDIESDPELAGTKLIAEAWDAAGLYKVGILSEIVGGSGTGGFETMFGVFFAAKRIPSNTLLTGCLVARQFTVMKNARLSKALIS